MVQWSVPLLNSRIGRIHAIVGMFWGMWCLRAGGKQKPLSTSTGSGLGRPLEGHSSVGDELISDLRGASEDVHVEAWESRTVLQSVGLGVTHLGSGGSGVLRCALGDQLDLGSRTWAVGVLGFFGVLLLLVISWTWGHAPGQSGFWVFRCALGDQLDLGSRT